MDRRGLLAVMVGFGVLVWATGLLAQDISFMAIKGSSGDWIWTALFLVGIAAGLFLVFRLRHAVMSDRRQGSRSL